MELMTCKDVAAALRVSCRQVWKLRSAGKLPNPVRLSRSVRWRACDISRFVELSCDMRRFGAETAGAAR